MFGFDVPWFVYLLAYIIGGLATVFLFAMSAPYIKDEEEGIHLMLLSLLFWPIALVLITGVGVVNLGSKVGKDIRGK